jgi:4-amino-4-deoxy-L-arabinose transferase-like glycosyltransferase
MSSGFMSHLSTLCALVWCNALLLPGPVRRRSVFLAGLLAGFAFLIRPFTAVALLAPVLIWVIWNHRKQWKSVPGLILAGAVPSLIVFFLYNRLVFGNMFQSGYPFDPQFEVAGLGIGVFVHNFFWYWRNLNDCLWGFPWPDLFTLIFLALPAKSSRKYDLLLLACTASLVIAYCFYSYTDIVYSGPRYVFEGVFLIAILAARSLLALWKILRSQLRVSVGVGIAAFATILFFPLLVRFPQQARFHAQNYHGQVHALIAQLEEHGVSRKALIFVGGDPYIYRTFFLLNALNPAEGDRVFVRDIGSQREEIRRLYPRSEEWSLLVELRPIPGPNDYADRWSVVNARWEKR